MVRKVSSDGEVEFHQSRNPMSRFVTVSTSSKVAVRIVEPADLGDAHVHRDAVLLRERLRRELEVRQSALILLDVGRMLVRGLSADADGGPAVEHHDVPPVSVPRKLSDTFGLASIVRTRRLPGSVLMRMLSAPSQKTHRVRDRLSRRRDRRRRSTSSSLRCCAGPPSEVRAFVDHRLIVKVPAMRAIMAALVVMCVFAAPARAHDDSLPPGPGATGLPDQEWVHRHWLPFDERELEAALGLRGRELRGVPVRRPSHVGGARPYAGRLLGGPVGRLVARAVGDVSQRAVLRGRTVRVLTQGHLAQRLFFHVFHGLELHPHAEHLFGMPADAYRSLRDGGASYAASRMRAASRCPRCAGM